MNAKYWSMIMRVNIRGDWGVECFFIAQIGFYRAWVDKPHGTLCHWLGEVCTRSDEYDPSYKKTFTS